MLFGFYGQNLLVSSHECPLQKSQVFSLKPLLYNYFLWLPVSSSMRISFDMLVCGLLPSFLAIYIETISTNKTIVFSAVSLYGLNWLCLVSCEMVSCYCVSSFPEILPGFIVFVVLLYFVLPLCMFQAYLSQSCNTPSCFWLPFVFPTV